MRDERHRASSASVAPPRPRSAEEAFDRLQALETRVLVYEERIDTRLTAGAVTMTELKSALSDLRPKRQNLLGAASLALAIAGIVFAAGRYPDRTELERTQERSADAVLEMSGKVHGLERDLVKFRVEYEARIEAMRVRIEQQAERQTAEARRRMK